MVAASMASMGSVTAGGAPSARPLGPRRRAPPCSNRHAFPPPARRPARRPSRRPSRLRASSEFRRRSRGSVVPPQSRVKKLRGRRSPTAAPTLSPTAAPRSLHGQPRLEVHRHEVEQFRRGQYRAPRALAADDEDMLRVDGHGRAITARPPAARHAKGARAADAPFGPVVQKGANVAADAASRDSNGASAYKVGPVKPSRVPCGSNGAAAPSSSPSPDSASSVVFASATSFKVTASGSENASNADGSNAASNADDSNADDASIAAAAPPGASNASQASSTGRRTKSALGGAADASSSALGAVAGLTAGAAAPPLRAGFRPTFSTFVRNLRALEYSWSRRSLVATERLSASSDGSASELPWASRSKFL
ncbi:hypothetical protein M885DRAFT_532305, partial [Pelagophyceae sp. CCMP2097]